MLLLWLLFAATKAQELLSNPRCNLPLDRGSCIQFSVRWYYDRYDHRCRRFHYGGCEGNENRFDSLEECSAACHFEPTSNRERCFQPHDPGECNNDIERWFFDMNKKQCVCSWWTGCGGNSNLFYSYPHCMFYCGEFAEHGPGVDENYWGKRNKSTMSHASMAVLAGNFQFPQASQQHFQDRKERGFDWSQQSYGDQQQQRTADRSQKYGLVSQPQDHAQLQNNERETYGLEQRFPDQREQIARENYEQALRQTREEDEEETYQHGSVNGRQHSGYHHSDTTAQAGYHQSVNGRQQPSYQQSQQPSYQQSQQSGYQHSQQASYQHAVSLNSQQQARYQQTVNGGQHANYQHSVPTNGDQQTRYQQSTNGRQQPSYQWSQQPSYQHLQQPSHQQLQQPSYQQSVSVNGHQQARYQQSLNGQQRPSYQQNMNGRQQSGYQQRVSANGDQQTRYQTISSNGDHRTQYQQTTSPNGRTVVVTRTGPGYRDQRIEQQQWTQKVQPSSRYSEFRSTSSHSFSSQSHFHQASSTQGYQQRMSEGWYNQMPRARGDRIYR